MEIHNKEVECSQKLSKDIIMTTQCTDTDREFVCKNLLKHNIQNTFGLLKRPGIDINLYLKDKGVVIGAIMCDTYNLCMYIDVLWLEESYRKKGYGRVLIERAERIAKENGCVFSHTCTFSYQSPQFYKACGYEVFAQLSDYPDKIVQFFLKKKL